MCNTTRWRKIYVYTQNINCTVKHVITLGNQIVFFFLVVISFWLIKVMRVLDYLNYFLPPPPLVTLSQHITHALRSLKNITLLMDDPLGWWNSVFCQQFIFKVIIYIYTETLGNIYGLRETDRIPLSANMSTYNSVRTCKNAVPFLLRNFLAILFYYTKHHEKPNLVQSFFRRCPKWFQ